MHRHRGTVGSHRRISIWGRDSQKGKIVAESTNRVASEQDVTRHAEVVAISQAQKVLGSVSLADCVLYSTFEPCAYCSYAIRESRIGRVVFALYAPFTGGHSKWNVLTDASLSKNLPEVFDPPPVVIGGFMSIEADRALDGWNPLIWGVMKKRGVFVSQLRPTMTTRAQTGLWDRGNRRFIEILRFLVFDRFGR